MVVTAVRGMGPLWFIERDDGKRKMSNEMEIMALLWAAGMSTVNINNPDVTAITFSISGSLPAVD